MREAGRLGDLLERHALVSEAVRLPSTVLREFVRRHERLNRVRKRFRFAQEIPLGDVLNGRARAGLRVQPYTLLNYARLASIHRLAASCPPGAFVECGVWSGGSAAMMALADSSRDMWLFDSWQGLPEPSERDVAVDGHRRNAGWNLAERERVEQVMFKKLGMSSERVRLVQGWFEETIPVSQNRIGDIALLHLDCDWYASVKGCLELLYEQVVRGGWVVVDDYHHWAGAREAVDEFLGHADPVELHRVDVAVHWRK